MQFEGLALRLVPIKTPSDKSISIYGSGRVETHKAYDNIMNKFEWGNLDKEDVFVNDSYGAAIQAHRMVSIRTAEALLAKGEVKKAQDIVDKFFEGFPHFNFPYDASLVPLMNVYVRTRDKEKAMHHIRILAEETADWMDFFQSVDPGVIQSSFVQDYSRRQTALQNVLSMANNLGDAAFKQEMETLLSNYQVQRVPN